MSVSVAEIFILQIPSFSKLGVSVAQYTFDDDHGRKLFCLNLAVVQYELPWTSEPVYAKCKVPYGGASSKWYKLDRTFSVLDRESNIVGRAQRVYSVKLNNLTVTAAPASASFSPATESLPLKPEETTIIVSAITFSTWYFHAMRFYRRWLLNRDRQRALPTR